MARRRSTQRKSAQTRHGQPPPEAEADESGRKTLSRPQTQLGTTGCSAQCLELRQGYGRRSQWWDCDLLSVHPVYKWVAVGLQHEARALLASAPRFEEPRGGLGLSRGRILISQAATMPQLQPGRKLTVSVKNTGRKLYVEVYGSGYGCVSLRLKLDFERGLLHVQEGLGRTITGGEQARLCADGPLLLEADSVLWPFVRSLDVPPCAPGHPASDTHPSADALKRGGAANTRRLCATGLYRESDMLRANRATLWAFVLCRHRAAQQGSAFGRLPDVLLAMILERALIAVEEGRAARDTCDTTESVYHPSKWGDYQRRAFEGRLDAWHADWYP